MSSLVSGLHRRRWILGMVAVLTVALSTMTVIGAAAAGESAAVKLRIVTANVFTTTAIDGFYVPSDAVSVVAIKKPPKGNSDHHPIRMVAQVG